MDRRTFVVGAGTALGALRAAGAGDRINVGVVGVRGRGREHISIIGSRADATVAAVCDVDSANNERAAALAEKTQGRKPKEYRDIRQLLDDKSIDAISIATCNH